MKIILGSTSPYKKSVLEKAGYEFQAMSPDFDEFSVRTENYYELPLLLARGKARSLTSKVSEPALIIGTDIVVVCDGQLYEKPESEDQARAWLRKYGQGYSADCPCGLCVINTATGKIVEGTNVATITFNPIPEDVIEDFIKNGDPYSKAGGFSVKLPFLKPYIKEMVGTVDCMMGMPIDLLKRLLHEAA